MDKLLLKRLKVGGIIVLMIILIWRFFLWATEYGYGDLPHRPFYSVVWGTFGDWFFGAFAVITAFLLYRVNRKQLEVHKKQIELVEVEKLRMKLSLAPDFDLIDLNISSLKKFDRNEYHVIFCGNGNSAKKLECEATLRIINTNNVEESILRDSSQLSSFHGLSKNLKFRFFTFQNIDKRELEAEIILRFQDVIGNPYSIMFTAVYRNGQFYDVNKDGPNDVRIQKFKKDGRIKHKWIKNDN